MRTARVALRDAQITYDEHGHGPSGIVFVPGWCCSRDNFAGILPVIATAGWRAVAMDTVGFFDSTTSRDSFTVEAAAEDLVALVGHLDLTTVVLAGHSAGGAVALEAARRVRDAEVVHVVGIDSLHYLHRYPQQDQAAIESTVAPFIRDRRAAVEATVPRYWPTHQDHDLVAATIEQMSAPPENNAISLFTSVLAWDMDSALATSRCPVTVLACAALLEQAAIDRYGERMNIVPTDLGGHFFLRQRPRATAELILHAVGEPSPNTKEGQE